MPKSHIDSTALAAVVIASAVALLLPVSLAWLSSIAGLTLLFVLLSFDREGYRSVFQSLAFAAVFAICLALAVYEPLQVLAGSGQPHPAADPRVTGEWLPVIWVCVTVIFWGIDRGRMSGRESVGTESARPAAAGHRAFIPEPAASPVSREVHPEPAPVPPSPVVPPPPVFTPPAASSTATMWGLSSTPSPSPQLVRRQPEPAPAPVETPSAPAPPPEAVPLPRSGKETMIYVTLLGEGLNVLRSVRAEHLGRDFYQIIDVMPEGETWEYRPGQIVRCKKKNLSSGKAWVAVEEAPRAS